MKARPGFVALLAVATACVGVVPAAASDHSSDRSPVAFYDAHLGGGELRGVEWEVSTYREGAPLGRHDHRRPCLDASLVAGGGMVFHSLQGCYEAGDLRPDGEPLMAVVREGGATLVGAAFAPTARTLVAEFADGNRETIGLHRLNAKQARKVRRERFRYTAFIFDGEWCPQRLASLDGAGRQLWSLAFPSGCPESSKAAAWVEGIS